MIDTDSSNFAVANASDYFVRNGFGEQALLTWWHGTGGLLD
jgi:alpha-glucosidase (family GH31 glycosyl hydrolase)